MGRTGVGQVVAVNVGVVEPLEHAGRQGHTAIRKRPVAGPVTVTAQGLDGDEVADTASHGTPLRAVYAYAGEDLAWWSGQLDRPLPPGSFGENLTLEGLDVTGARSGDRWRVGTALLEVTVPRTPCWKLAWALGEDGIERSFRRASRPGAYLAVVEPGLVAAGDEARVVRRREDHDLAMGAVATALHVDRRQRDRLREQAAHLDAPVAAWVRDALVPLGRRRRGGA